MVSRVSTRRWLLRDIPRTYVVLVWAACIVGILMYFTDWSPIRQETVAKPKLNNGENNETAGQRYTGSIIVPTHGAFCWEWMFDNRTGRMIDKGYVNCDEAAAQIAEKNPRQGMDVIRLRAIGKAFQRESN
jgi:hypothetical protein